MAPSFFGLVKQRSRLELAGGRERSKEIDRILQDEKKRRDREVKVLLLGAADSGKSTIIKQMRIIHHGGFPDAERRRWKNVIFRDLVDSFLYLLDKIESQHIELENEANMSYRELLREKRNIGENEGLPSKYFHCFQSLWDDFGLQMTMLRAVECALSAHLLYFMQNLDRLFEADYLPSDKDMLYARSSTTGIHETQFNLENHIYRMIDVGGQRSERKKWIQAFDDVRAVLFVAAINAYDQYLPEDPAMSQLEEALKLFQEMSNHPILKPQTLILFLNKMDLLDEKLKNGLSPIGRYYPDYKGKEADVEVCRAYFADKFKRSYEATKTKTPLYIHFTNATDTTLLDVTMKTVQLRILQHNISEVLWD